MAEKKKRKHDTDTGAGATVTAPGGKRLMTGWLTDLRYGRSLSVDFFTHNAWLLILIVVTMLALIGLRYKTKSKMAQIKALTIELDRAESAKLQEKSNYMSLIREKEMRRLVDEKHLGLDFQEQPPYELTLDTRP